MANHTRSKQQGPRIFILNRRAVISAILLIIVVFLISSNTFWRWMYPIGYQENIQHAARLTHVDPLLVASVIRVESQFHSKDVSHAGAIGLMQLMPDTAAWIAGQMQHQDDKTLSNLANKPEHLSEPAFNIVLGSWYINYLIHRFNGNTVAAIAAYNGGPQRVQQWLASKQWPGTLSTIDRIPVGETRHFVDRVFYNYELYHRIYGNDVEWQRK